MDVATVFICLFGIFTAMLIIFNGIFYGAMYTRIPKRKLDKIIKLGNLKEGMIVYDLGAGFGRIMLEATKSGASVTGFEIDRFKCFWIRQQIKKENIGNAKIINGNLLNADFSKPNLIYAYLSPPLMQKIGQKAKKELKSGTRIISVEHPIHGWQPSYTDSKDKIFIYEKT